MRVITGGLAAIAILLAACSGSSGSAATDPVSSQPVSTESGALEPSSDPSGDPGADRPLDPRLRHIQPRVTRSVSDSSAGFGLTGVYRIAPDVVVVVGVLTPGRDWEPWALSEPVYTSADAADFSRVSLAVAGDDRTFLPLRTERGHCLCSPLRAVGSDPTTVHVLIGIPEGAQTVTLTVGDLGSIADEPVVALPDGLPRVGLGPRYNLEIVGVTRAAGAVTATVRVENPTDDSTRLPRGAFDPVFIADPSACFRSVAVIGADGRTAGVVREEGCQRGYLPSAHRYVDLTVHLGDPMGRSLVFLPSLGAPLRGTVVRGPVELGDRNVIVGRDRFRTGEIEVLAGPQQQLRVPLRALIAPATEGTATGPPESPSPTALSEAVLAEGAGAVLDSIAQLAAASQPAAASEPAAGSEPAALSLTVHLSGSSSDGPGAGSGAQRQARSRAQAELLVGQLRERLGDTWQVTGTGVGGSEPLLAGPPGSLDPGLAELNNRVEIRVGRSGAT